MVQCVVGDRVQNLSYREAGMAKRVFVIYGRDSLAHTELVKFLEALGLEVLGFDEVAGQLGPAPFIADIVTRGIAIADAVVALFTPDEQAVLYDPDTGRSIERESGGARWQARPNVIFEAGVAYGLGKAKPILTVLGADVRLFSDVGSMHFVELDGPGAKQNLHDRLTAVLGPLKPTRPDWATSPESGDFQKCIRKRWPAFDEIEVLARYLQNRRLDGTPLIEIVSKVACADQRDWSVLHARDFMDEIDQNERGDCTDLAYWWLVVYGFFQFDNIEYWGTVNDATWIDSVDEARFAPRGVALIERLRAIPP